MAKGDKVQVILQVGDKVEKFDAVATANGETVEVNRARDKTEVLVLGHTGKVKRTLTFKPEAVLGVIETPQPRS